MENKELIGFIEEVINRKLSGIYKTNEFQNLNSKFFLDKNYDCKFQFVDIVGDVSQTLIEYSKSIYLFFIEEKYKSELYICYDIDSKNEFTLLLNNLKQLSK